MAEVEPESGKLYMSNGTKLDRARNADYCDAYEALPDNYGYSREQMLIVLKAYERYLEDVKEGMSEDVCGFVDDDYDIGPAVFHSSMSTISVADLVKINPVFWDCTNGKIKLSEKGRMFVNDSPELLRGARLILCGVGHVRKG